MKNTKGKMTHNEEKIPSVETNPELTKLKNLVNIIITAYLLLVQKLNEDIVHTKKEIQLKLSEIKNYNG